MQELSRYRSDFFGRLREILGDRPDIRIVGDRFVFQSEVLLRHRLRRDQRRPASRNSTSSPRRSSSSTQEIPDDIPWVLRIDGHTDKRPITSTGGRFRTNWDLSAARAISVVRFLIDKGIPADRLVAAGFGEFQPLEEGETEDASPRTAGSS